MYKKIFFDTNIIVDIFDDKRVFHQFSLNAHAYIINQGIELFTSSDIITTIYYILSKRDKSLALEQIMDINQTLKIIEFSNKEVIQTCNLMKSDTDYKDLEDTMQYILAQNIGCDLIISNDKNFISKELKMMSSEEFCSEVLA
ncbi:MAG TPA: PIN domain-containing protein [Campylobacterales bacterium]|nr:PIN domain-containing protein [Campylobacterales bacterium]